MEIIEFVEIWAVTDDEAEVEEVFEVKDGERVISM